MVLLPDNSDYRDSIKFTIINNTPYHFEITPQIGLAYYDGMDDGNYNPSIGSFNLVTDYPALYSGGKEYLNLIEGKTIIYPPFSISSNNHCPVKSC